MRHQEHHAEEVSKSRAREPKLTGMEQQDVEKRDLIEAVVTHEVNCFV